MKTFGKMLLFNAIALVCCALCWCHAEAGKVPPTRVEVTELPGWNGKLPSKWFTGYLNGGKKEDGRQLWYHYTLILSENDPENDPLILWSNGGPGASSNFGLFTELGPFYLSAASMKTKEFNTTGIPTLFRNDYSWSKLGSLLILNGPPPVSFSYCDPPGPHGTGFDCGKWDDASTAKANYQFIESFYKTHPEFAENDLYLTGESYAGIYIPTLAREIMKRDKSESLARRVLKGIAVGDGCVGSEIICGNAGGQKGTYREWEFKVQFLYGHHQISTKLYQRFKEACPWDTPTFDHAKCDAAIEKVKNRVGYYFDYNLYDECWDDANLPTMNQIVQPKPAQALRESMPVSAETLQQQDSPQRLGGALTDYPCGGGGALSAWIQHPKVREAIGVEKSARFVSGDNSQALDYELSERNLMPLHKSFALDTDLRVFIYNGDTDPGLNSFIGEWWTSNLGLEELEEWRPWTLDGKKKVVGYVTTYEGGLQYITIRGSGHMVPQMKPKAAFEMLRSFLANEPLKRYQP